MDRVRRRVAISKYRLKSQKPLYNFLLGNKLHLLILVLIILIVACSKQPASGDALQAKGGSGCDQVSVKDDKVVCNMQTPVIEVSDCDKIDVSKELFGRGMLINCYAQVANEKGDLSICSRLEWPLSSVCYQGVAELKGDVSPCIEIKDPEGAKDNSGISDCISAVAVKKEDVSVCDKIKGLVEEDAELEEQSTEFCYRDVAVAKKEDKLCGMIGDSGIRSYCLVYISPEKQSPALCEQIEDDEIFGPSLHKDLCFEYLAVFRTDAPLCEKIDAEYLRDDCFNSIARKTSDAKMCERIIDNENKGKCIGNVKYDIENGIDLSDITQPLP